MTPPDTANNSVVLTAKEAARLCELIEDFCGIWSCDPDELLVGEDEIDIYTKLKSACHPIQAPANTQQESPE